MIKHNLVTADMVREVLHNHSMQDTEDDIAKKLNDLIHSKCLYCDEGDSGCQCWNDE